MDFYTIDYVEAHIGLNNYFLYVLLGIAVIAIIFYATRYFQHQIDTRYRDLTIIAILFFCFFAGLQYSRVVASSNEYKQTTYMPAFIRGVARDHQVNVKAILVSDTTLHTGLIVRIKKRDYQLDLNQDNNSYRLTRAHVIDPHVYVNR